MTGTKCLLRAERRALAFDSKDVEGVIEGLDILKERFVGLMKDARGAITS